jgi:hypothetical protein
MKSNEYCEKLELWAREHSGLSDEVIREVYSKVHKSCLLDRMLNCGENPSKTPCPVHKGIWSGCHVGWPNQTWGSNNQPIPESQMLRVWYDAGCRCYKHKCGCTTGWLPDEACGCGVKT